MSQAPRISWGVNAVPARDRWITLPVRDSANNVIRQIEQVFESMLDALINGSPFLIPYSTRGTTGSRGPTQQGGDPTQSQPDSDVLRYPGQSVHGLKKFQALLRILGIVHESLLSGTYITKRNLYYQLKDLYESPAMVYDMIDNLAFTLGIGREELNIVAMVKGLIAGPIDLKMRNGPIMDCSDSPDSGCLIPSTTPVEAINFRSAKWLLVIEKEATFRTLVPSEYYRNSSVGHGILVTAKGYPDLGTRRFLHVLQSVRPDLLCLALVDFDPHGISIFRTYKNGSGQLEHEAATAIPRLRLLGVRSSDVIPYLDGDVCRIPTPQSSQRSESQTSQRSTDGMGFSSGGQTTAARLTALGSEGDTHSSNSGGAVLPLTVNDRRKALELMQELDAAQIEETFGNSDDTRVDEMQELQKMLMLNIKAEIQAVDRFGDITGWLDQKLREIPPNVH